MFSTLNTAWNMDVTCIYFKISFKKSGMKDPIKRERERGVPILCNFSHHKLVIIMIPFYKLMLRINLKMILEICTLTNSQPRVKAFYL